MAGWFSRMAAQGEEIDRLTAQLPPADRLVFDGLDAPLVEAVTQAAAGQVLPLAALLGHARDTGDWARHGHAVRRLSFAALAHPAGILDWAEAEPDNPDALVSAARLQVRLAWAARSAKRASKLSDGQIADFFALLDQALPTIQRAIELAPDSPTAIEAALTHARGSQAPPEVVEELAEIGRQIAPEELGWQRAVLLYLSPRWFGSAEQSWEFAATAAQHASPDSLLHLLPADSLADAFAWSRMESRSGGMDRGLLEQRLDPVIERLHELLRATNDRTRYLDIVNALAYLLSVADRAADASDAFHQAGTHVADWPWTQVFFPDTVKGFDTLRRAAVVARAKRNLG